MSVVLGFDLGTHCGWAVYIDGVHKTSGTWHFEVDKRHAGRRYALALDRFIWVIRQYDPDVIAFEDVHRHTGTMAAHVYGALKAILHLAAYNRAEPAEVVGFGVSTIKKRATGKGVASKKQMIAAARKRLGVNVTDDNQADALWICVLGCDMRGDHVIDRVSPMLPGVR